MQLSVTKKRFASPVCALFIASIFFAGCHRTNSPSNSPVRVSLCELYQHAAAYDGKLITVAGTVTGLAEGNYLYPGTVSNECGYSFIRFDADPGLNANLSELKPPTKSSPQRKEFDVEVTGRFDANYSEGWDAFRYRLVPTDIKALSPVRTGKPLGAA